MRRVLKHLPGGSAPALAGSFASLASQALFALFLLKLFEPAAVGVFSLVNQLAFSWATLALAQSTLSLLADRGDAAHRARHAWTASAMRMVWLAPFAVVAWLWSSPDTASNRVAPLVWIAGIALAQMTWSIAQSLTLRGGSGAAIFLVRCVPPALAAVLAWIGAHVFARSEATALLAAALVGYALGSLWMAPAFGARAPQVASAAADGEQRGHDDRSNRLKMAHTLLDLVASTLIAVQWTRTWGSVEAGYLLVLLRVYGFVPALVHTAWAQVLLSRGEARVRSSLAVGAGCGLVILALAALVELALAMNWLSASWSGLRAYVWPLAVWQIAACAFGCLSHIPFITGGARAYSRQCIAVDVMLIALLLLAPLAGLAPARYVLVVAGCMTVALLAQVTYFRRVAARMP